MSGATAKACFTVGFFVLLVLVGIPPVIAVWSYLRVINRELREGLKKWNGRWVELLELDDSEIKERLHAASLHLGNDKRPIQNGGTA
jgi:hypothetical protein